MEEIITKAIENKQMLRFRYKDELRVVEPYTFGISKKGNDQLRAFQTETESGSDDIGWKFFTIDEIDNVTILDNKFEPTKDGYSPENSEMIVIYTTAQQD